MIIAPSILSADFANLAAELRAVDAAGADWIHVDVMDGNFVPNLTFGPPVIKKLRPHTAKPFDVHLMITNAEAMLPDYLAAGANHITVHVEAVKDLAQVLSDIRAGGAKAGVSLKPATSVDEVLPYLELLDLVLVMTVEPGFGGQKFMADQLIKIETLRAAIDASGHEVKIVVDGGINPDTIARAAKAGATAFVAGSAVFKGGDYAANISRLRQLASQVK